MKDNQTLAKDILELVGGSKNVNSVTHCATRLRFVLNDEEIVAKEALNKMPEVLQTVKSADQFQVVIGPKVAEIYQELLQLMGDTTSNAEKVETTSDNKKSPLDKFLSTLSAIFTPYISVLAGVGVMKGIVVLISTFHWLPETSMVYVILNILSSGLFTLLPLFIAITAADRFKASRFTALALAAALVFPLTSPDIPDTLSLFGIDIGFKIYGGAVIPTILAILFLSYVEKWLKRIIPEVASLVFVPFLSLVISGFVTFLFIGPVANYIGIAIGDGYTWLYNLSPTISGALLAGVGQFFVVFGIHWGIMPIGLLNTQQFGYDTIMAMFMSAVMGQFGAVFGTIFRAKNKDARQISISAAVSAFFGITEPALYGVNLKYKYPFIFGCIGAAIGGGITGFFRVKLYGFAPVLNVFMLGMFQGPESNMWYELLAMAAAFFTAALLTIIFWKNKEQSDSLPKI